MLGGHCVALLGVLSSCATVGVAWQQGAHHFFANAAQIQVAAQCFGSSDASPMLTRG